MCSPPYGGMAYAGGAGEDLSTTGYRFALASGQRPGSSSPPASRPVTHYAPGLAGARAPGWQWAIGWRFRNRHPRNNTH
ncbi:hypothetical protein SAMD00023353_0300950 [Rosellinia necatrix]|uniref:Uncharacterized protein n=1 Tax=Rosellinia necatrix TaxID=77044 RepID=A0A1S8A579_ROSNE|nr:hypothetical protein SAMD00023353_0300950 [Rosellinia necatrix]